MYRAESSTPLLNRIHLGAFVVAILGVAFSAVFAILNPAAFFPSYLVAFLYWTELSLGCLGFLLLLNLVQGAWGIAVQRIMAAGARTLLLMAVLFLPLAFGVKKIYPWAMSNTFQGVTLHQPIHYLSVPGFLTRALVAFVIWGVLAFVLSHWSYQHDTTNRTALLRWAGRLSGLGIVLFVITTSLAAFDWSMSLDPLWFSSVYGWLAVAREGLVAFSLAVIVLALFSKQAPIAAFLTQRLVNDLSKLLLGTVMLWMYLHFFQYLIMWYGNLPRDIRWFVPRLADGWGIVVLVLIAFHFVLPFLMLIMPHARRPIGQLAAIGGLILIMHLVELYWLVLPAFRPTFALYPLDFILPIAMGGLWVSVFLWWLRSQHVLPVHREQESGTKQHESASRQSSSQPA